METSIVLGSQFGDEGKGSFVNFLCKNSKSPLVIRFNGGHQAGHTVLSNEIKHTFSSFGSGTFCNVPTFWSRFCTVYPTAVYNEYNILHNHFKIDPIIYYDPLCPVTTPYDLLCNKLDEKKNGHGSVIVGFGATIKRHEEYYKLYYKDIFNKTIFEAKMSNIKLYYCELLSNRSIEEIENLEKSLKNWYRCIDFLINNNIFNLQSLYMHKYSHVIFEGAQGILLDMDFGFFPNVTRSNTTSKNAFTLIKEFDLNKNVDIFYISRTYQTRHGAGFMSNLNLNAPELINTDGEINIFGNQGEFRKSVLDLDLIKYAIDCDFIFSNNCKKNIVITCLDQIPDLINYTINQKLHIDNLSKLTDNLSELTNIKNFQLGISEGNFKEHIK